MFRVAPRIELDPAINCLNDDVNGSGNTLTLFSKKIASNTMQKGRDGILVDVPAASDDETAAASGDKVAKLIQYSAERIINWKVKDGQLIQVVLEEDYEAVIDDFESEIKKQYRVLYINGDGKYSQRVYRDEIPGEEIVIKDFSGAPLDEITFVFVGTINNDSEIDPSLLYSIAEVNKGHYRNSADLEENSFMHGQMTLGVTTSLDDVTWLRMNPKGIKVGAMYGTFLGDNGAFHSVQANANSLTAGIMKDKENQMIALGARLIQPGGGSEREASVLSRVGAETATISSLAYNVSDAIETCLSWAMGFMTNKTGDNVFQLSQDFYPVNLDPQSIMALTQLHDRGRIADSDLHYKLQQSGIMAADRTLEDVQSEASTKDPLTSTVL
jgi:hypothetical protein